MSMVSAIITTYKCEPSMELRTLDSILLQTYSDIEVIVVDDSPNDYSLREDVRLAVQKRHDESPRYTINYIQLEKNMGACVARNTGLTAASGEYIAYLDDDDQWLPEKAEKQSEVIKMSEAALVYYGSICVNDDNGRSDLMKKGYIRGSVFQKLLYYNFVESTSYPLIRKKCLIYIGGFDPLMQSAQYYDVQVRHAKQYEIDYVPEPLVRYHDHSEDRITSNQIKKINAQKRINQKDSQYLKKDRKLLCKRNIGISRQYSLNGDLDKSLELWFKCVIKCP